MRSESQFRDWITADGATGFKAEAGRYHLYVALSCPWAHRTVIMRALKGLEDVVGMSVVDRDILASSVNLADSSSPVTSYL